MQALSGSSRLAWVRGLSVALACAACSAGATDGNPDDAAMLPAFPGAGGTSTVAPNQPGRANNNSSGSSSTPASPNTNSGNSNDANQTGGGPVAPTNNGGNTSGSSNTGGTNTGSAGAGGSAASSSNGGAAGTQSVPPQDPGNQQPPPPAPGDAFFLDGFEGVAAGASPSTSIWTVFDNYNQTSVSANVQVSAGNAHSGGQALRVAAASGRSGIVASLPQASYFVRAWLQVDSAPRGPVLIGLGTDQNAETRLRIFNQSWATINAVPGDAVRPDGATSGNCPTCITLVPNQWFCAEMSVDNVAKTATLWINGVEAAALTNAPAQPAAPKMFVGSMGLEGGQTGVWIDDVVAGRTRIGCD